MTGEPADGGSLVLPTLLVALFVLLATRNDGAGITYWGAIGGLALIAALWFVQRRWKALGRKISDTRRRLLTLYDFSIFAIVVVSIIAASIYLATDDKVELLKILTVGYFSILPALLYLQFSSRKTLPLWRDYVSNLYKLRIDVPANLPRPPTLSKFHAEWLAAREQAWQSGVLKELNNDTRDMANERIETANQYRAKFRELFGDIPLIEEPKTVLSLQSAHKLQVVMATALITLGWTFVIQPETVFGHSFAPRGFRLTHLPVIPSQTFAFAFLGAYFYILQVLVRRYFQNDLKATAYINATMRIVIVILLVWVLDPILAESMGQATRSAIAFVIGVFPTVGWQLLTQAVIRKPAKLVSSSLDPKHKLGDLDGLNIWYESRLLEVGIEDMQNLTTTDIVDLMLNTRIPVDRIIDWIDQAFLYMRITSSEERELLRGYGVRTATDLEDGLSDPTVKAAFPGILPATAAGTVPSRVECLVATLKTERNMEHVRAWKGYAGNGQPSPKPPQRGRRPASGS